MAATYLTAYKNPDNNADRVSTPAGLTDLFGLRVGEVDVVHDDTRAEMLFCCGNKTARFRNAVWTESLELDGAAPLVTYADTFRAGEAAAALHPYGEGLACYLGTELSEDAKAALLPVLAERAGVKPLPVRCGGCSDVAVRWREDGTPVYFLFNGEEREASMEVLEPLRTLDGALVESGVLRLPPKGMLICQPEPAMVEPEAEKVYFHPDALPLVPVMQRGEPDVRHEV